jgi:hypothetical protein
MTTPSLGGNNDPKTLFFLPMCQCGTGYVCGKHLKHEDGKFCGKKEAPYGENTFCYRCEDTDYWSKKQSYKRLTGRDLVQTPSQQVDHLFLRMGYVRVKISGLRFLRAELRIINLKNSPTFAFVPPGKYLLFLKL